MKARHYCVDEVLPHARPMILIDEIVGYDEQSLTALVKICEKTPFFQPNLGVAAHIGLEWMAQACGAYSGVQALRAGGTVEIGLLLGTRNFEALIAFYAEDASYLVQVSQALADAEIGAFDCAIRQAEDSRIVATAQLIVYRPRDTATFFASARSKRAS